ncbi:protein ANTAGONIST OF LIKE HETEROCHROMATIN PROTEIN 1-like [Haliotis rubra]|uniref:protein ANTAGONIST OF LIKE HETEROCHROMATIN PROTEIN 1-like n=1 Tax=Haliotis rubra TaxID=36100 RepID=UPI001EE54A98|nr:protein ANTAGONIST OF LIKE HETEROCHROMATIN PROTEIN 1-like [Haliotis rubra]
MFCSNLLLQMMMAVVLMQYLLTVDQIPKYRTVANLFGVGKATVCICVHQVCEAIMKLLLTEYVRFPKGDALKDVIRGYEERWGFPNCVGSIDGSHIPIIAPNFSHGDYLNRKGFYSLILQGTFISLVMMVLLPNWSKNIGNTQMPLVLLGDAAYPLKSWLLKPYTGRANLTPAQSTFNYRLSRARMTIENAFGRLNGRWRCLQKRMDVDVEFACTVITCCVVLHNICESVRDLYKEDWDTEEDGEENDYQLDVQDGGDEGIQCAKALRDEIALAFCNDVF